MHALYSFTLEVTEQHKMLRLISFRQQVPTYPKIIAGKPHYRIQSRFVWKFSWGQGFQRRSSLILSSKERNHADGREGLCLPSLFLLWAFSRPRPSVATKCKTRKGFPHSSLQFWVGCLTSRMLIHFPFSICPRRAGLVEYLGRSCNRRVCCVLIFQPRTRQSVV